MLKMADVFVWKLRDFNPPHEEEERRKKCHLCLESFVNKKGKDQVIGSLSFLIKWNSENLFYYFVSGSISPWKQWLHSNCWFLNANTAKVQFSFFLLWNLCLWSFREWLFKYTNEKVRRQELLVFKCQYCSSK